MTIHAVLFWLIAGSGLVVGCVDGWLGADVFLRERGVRPGRLSLPLAALLGGLYLFAVCATLMAILRCPYPLAVDTYNRTPGLTQIVAMSPVGLLVLALARLLVRGQAARLRPVIAGLGRGAPALVVATEPAEPADERTFAEPTVHEVAAEPHEAEPEAPRPFTFDHDLADAWADIDARLRAAA